MTGKTKTIYVLGLALLLCVVSVVVYMGAFALVKQEAQNASTASFNLTEQQDKKNNIDTVKKLLADTAQQRTDLDTYFLYSDQIVTFTHDLEDWGKKVGVIAERSSLSEQDKQTLVFGVHATGSFNNIMRFLDVLENLPYSTSIESVTFSESTSVSKDGKTTSSTWDANFTARILSYVQNKTI